MKYFNSKVVIFKIKYLKKKRNVDTRAEKAYQFFPFRKKQLGNILSALQSDCENESSKRQPVCEYGGSFLINGPLNWQLSSKNATGWVSFLRMWMW